MGVDWGSVAAQSRGISPGKPDWGSQSAWNLPTSIPTSGGGGGSSGGLFDSIGGFIGHELGRIPGEHAVAGALGGAAHLTGNLAKDIGGTISALPNLPGALYRFNKYDAQKYPLTLNPSQALRELEQSWSDPHSLGGGAVRPTVKSVQTDIRNVRTGNWHALAQHPLSPILDIAGVASLGGGALLKGAKFADAAGLVAKGGRVSRLADDSARVLKDEKLTEQLLRARTVQGRLAQNAFDRFSARHPALPQIGLQPRLNRITLKHSYYRTEAEKAIANKMVRAGNPLTHDEEFASHISAEGIPLRDRIALYGQLNAENPSRALQRYISMMKRPGVAEALKNPRPVFQDFLHQAHGTEATAGEALVDVGKMTPQIRAERAAAPMQFAREHGVTIGPSDISEKLPQGFRFPHVGTTGNPSLFRTPLGKLAGPQIPGMLKKSRLTRFAKGQFITNPQAVYSEDFMRSARYLHELDQQQHILTPVSRELNTAQTETYGKPLDGFYYWPADAQQAAKAAHMVGRNIPRHVREAAAREQDLGILDPAVHQEGVARAAEGSVSESLHGLGLEGQTVEHLKQLGVRWVPKAYGNAYRREFGRANGMVRLLVDKPTSAWRSLTLKYRPAWAVNNLLGQHLLYAMANPTLGGGASYAQAALHHRANRDVMESIPGMRQGFATTQKGITHTGGAQSIVDRSAALKTARALAMPVKAVVRPIQKMGDAIQFINQLGENIPREAQFMHLAKGKLDLVNQTLAEAVKTADPRVVQRLVDEMNSLQGDFGAMSHFERTVLRRVLPFYSWFKVITKLTGKYASRYPLRIKILQSMSSFLNEGNVNMPSYLQGFINLFQKAGIATGLSTTGLNPFQTVPQLLGSAGALVHGKAQFGTTNPGGLLNPGIQAAFTAFGGPDQFTGRTYRGPGANQGVFGRALGEFASGLPEYRLAEQAAGLGPQSKLYSQQHFAGLPPYLWNYLGLPVRRVKLPEARARAKAGQ